MRLVARGFEQTVSSDTDFYAGTPKLTTLRALLTIAALHGNPVAFGDCHSAFHQSPMPSDSVRTSVCGASTRNTTGRDFEHMKTSLYLTGVVVLRHEGDTVNMLGLEITKTSRGFEVKTMQTSWNPFSSLYGLENSKATANLGRRSTVMELASATPLDGHEYSNFRTAVGKLIFMAPWRPDM